MGKGKKVLAIALCIAITNAFSVSALAKVKYQNKLIASKKPLAIFFQRHQVKPISAEGTVEDIVQGKDGVMVLLKTNEMDDSLNGKVNLCINRNTEITSALNGAKLAASDIKKGMLIRAYYGPVLTSSIPPQSTAKKIVVGIEGTNGTIIEKSKGLNTDYILVSGKKIGDMGYDEIKLAVNSSTEIINGADGSQLSADNLKNNLPVKAYYGPVVTRSMPPIGGAEKIVIDLLKTEGTITDVQRNDKGAVITVESNKQLSDGSFEKVIITVDSNTQFLSGKDKNSVEDLKEGTKVSAYYGPIMIMIYPPRVHAEFLTITK